MERTIYSIAILMLFATSFSHASEDVSFGMGMGAMYSGFGMNIGLRSENQFQYIATGCVALGYSDAEGSITPCGVGAGWIWTNIFTDSNNRHGLGLYLGPVDWKRADVGGKVDTIYGGGISYTYFSRGINTNGWNLGGALAVGNNDGTNAYILLQAGYQY